MTRMEHPMMRTRFVLAVLLCAASCHTVPAYAGQVPTPVNAPASVTAGDALSATSNPQQAADSGVSLSAAGQNKVLAGPSSGGAGAAAFRALTNADMPSTGPGAGSVSSVGLTAPVEFTVSGAPVTAAGTLAIAKATQSANSIWAGPSSGSAAQPGFRALVSADMPATGAGSGTVMNVGLTSSSTAFSITGSPVTSSGTITLGVATQSSNQVWAGPTSGSPLRPAFRALVAADIPSLATLYAPSAVTTATTVAGLPAPSLAARGFVTDSTLPLTGTNLGAAVVGGGANKVPVYSDATAWYIG